MKLPRLIYTLIVSAPLAVSAQSRDIVVAEKTLVQRCVVAGVSSRSIAVGHPSKVSYLFDAVNCSLKFAWTGDFLDFTGETDGRGGKGVKVLGVRQALGSELLPLRISQPDSVPETLEFSGYKRDPLSGEPTFMFRVDGVGVKQSVIVRGVGRIDIQLDFSSNAVKSDQF